MEEVGVEKDFEFFGSGREKGAFAGFFKIGLEVDNTDGMAPEARPGFELDGVFGLNEAVLELGEEGSVGGVLEGAEHAGDVAQGSAFDAALAEGAGGFTFEIDDEKILSGVEDLAEVEIAMDPEAGAGDAGIGNGAEALEDFILEREDLLGVGADGFGK